MEDSNHEFKQPLQLYHFVTITIILISIYYTISAPAEPLKNSPLEYRAPLYTYMYVLGEKCPATL
jgi:hypothetical protein